MDGMHDRLRKARINAGYQNAADAARALGVGYPTYSAHENGSRGFKRDKAQLYSRRFNVSLEWLITGREKSRHPSGYSKEIVIAAARKMAEAGILPPNDDNDSTARALLRLFDEEKARLEGMDSDPLDLLKTNNARKKLIE